MNHTLQMSTYCIACNTSLAGEQDFENHCKFCLNAFVCGGCAEDSLFIHLKMCFICGCLVCEDCVAGRRRAKSFFTMPSAFPKVFVEQLGRVSEGDLLHRGMCPRCAGVSIQHRFAVHQDMMPEAKRTWLMATRQDTAMKRFTQHPLFDRNLLPLILSFGDGKQKTKFQGNKRRRRRPRSAVLKKSRVMNEVEKD